MQIFKQFLDESKIDRDEYINSGASRDKLRKKLEIETDHFIAQLNTKLKKNNYRLANKGQLRTLINKLIKASNYESFYDFKYKVKDNSRVSIKVTYNRTIMKIEVYAANDEISALKTNPDEGIFIVDFYNK